MSSRQTGSRYMNNGGSRKGYEGGVAGGLRNPGLVPTLLGQNKMTGGLVTGPDGKLSFSPVQGSSGLFGGQSRINAALLNAQLGSQVLGQQHEKELSAQEEAQQESLSKLQSTLQEHLGKSTQMNAIATKLGIPVDQLTQSISSELAKNALQDTKNTGAALNNPDVQKSYNTQLIAGNEAQGAKNASLRALNVPMGGIGVMPGMTTGSPAMTASGATPTQTTSMVGSGPINPATGQPMMQTPVTRQSYVPARANIPVPQELRAQVPNDADMPAAPDNGATSQASDNSTGSVGDLYRQLLAAQGGNANVPQQIPPQLSGLNVGNDNSQADSTAPTQDELVQFYQKLMSQMAGQQ